MKHCFLIFAVMVLLGGAGTSQVIAQCEGSLSVSEIMVRPAGGTFPVDLTLDSTCPWTATVADASGQIPNWVTVSPAQGTGSGKITVTVYPMTCTQTIRTVTVTVAGKTIPVKQPVCPTVEKPDSCPPFPKTEFGPDGQPLDIIENYADRAIQCNLDREGSLAIPAGTWVIGNEIVIRQCYTTLSGAGSDEGGTLLYAAPGLEGSIVQVDADCATIRDIRFNANRDRRAFISDCARGPGDYMNTTPDTNSVSAGDVANFTFENNRIDYTMCGTAMPLFGIRYIIKDNIIAFNGFSRGDTRANNGSWADGFSLGCHGLKTGANLEDPILPCEITGNTIVDATDVPIALFNPDHNIIANNRLLNLDGYAFGATGLPFKHNLADDGQTIDERVGPGMKIQDNTIISAHGLQAVGLTIGGAAYSCAHQPSLVTSGLTVDRTGRFLEPDEVPNPFDIAEYSGNKVWGAQIGLGALHLANMIVRNNTAEPCVSQAAVDLASEGLPADIQDLLQDAVGTCSDDRIMPGAPRGKRLPYVWDKGYPGGGLPIDWVTFENPGDWELHHCVNANAPPEITGKSCTDPIFYDPLFNIIPHGSTILLEASHKGGQVSFYTSHGFNCGWVTRLQNNDTPGIELRSHGVGGGGESITTVPTSGRFIADVAQNTDTKTRKWTYHLITRNNVRTQVVITQCPKASLSLSQIQAPPAGGTFPVSLTVDSECRWTAKIADASGQIPDWVTVSPAQGMGSATLTLTVQPIAFGTRTAIVTVAEETITITQHQPCPHLPIQQPSEPFTSAATSGQFSIVANNDCTYVAQALEDWVHLVGAKPNGTLTATGSQTLHFTLDRNTSTLPRAATIKVGDQQYVLNQKGALDPDSCVQILEFDGTTGTISAPQKIVLNVRAENGLEYRWYEESNPADPVSEDYQLIVDINPGAGTSITRRYYVEVSGKPECGTARSDTAIVTVQGVGITDTFNIKDDPPARIHSLPGLEIPITVEIVNDDPSSGDGFFPVKYEWFQGLTPDESSSAGGRQDDMPTRSTLWVSPFHDTSYWCKVTITSRRRTFSMKSGTARVFMPPPQRRRAVAHDFNYDGENDLLWRNTRTGAIRAWLMQDRDHVADMDLGSAPLSQELQSIGDLSNDGRSDFIFRDPQTGANTMWALTGAFAVPQALPSHPGPEWSIGAVADFNGDEAGDLVWYNRVTGETRAWLMNGAQKVGSWSFGFTSGGGWRLQGTADFDLDESPDLVFRNYDTGENLAWLMDGLAVEASFTTGTPIETLADVRWRPASFDDFTNDGRPDIYWFHTGTGQTQVWWMFNTLRGFITEQETEQDPEWQITGTGEGPKREVAADTTLTVNALPATYGGSTTLLATLASNGGDVTGKTIAFAINGTPVGTAVTDSGGGAVLAVDLGSYAAGTHSVTASFAGDATLKAANASTSLSIGKAIPVIRWQSPEPIEYGTPLSAAQLNATASVAGTFTYSPHAGTILGAGMRPLNVTFTPADGNYATASMTVVIIVNKATRSIAWATPVAIVYGTPLSSAQLNATAGIAGSFVYQPAAGTILEAGPHPLSVTFTPTDGDNYTTATATVMLTVDKATPVLTWPAPAAITYGAALSSTQLNAAADVAGAFVYAPETGTILDAGAHTLTAHFTPTDTRNYNDVDAEVAFTVEKAAQRLDWTASAAIVYGTPLSAAQLNAIATVVGPSPAGALTYVPAAGTVLDAGLGQVLTVNAAGTANYLPATATVRIDVLRAPLTVAANAASKLYGAPLPPLGGTVTGVRNNDDITPIFTTTATIASPVGTYSIEASLRDPNDRLANYDVIITNATLTVLRAPLVIRVNDAAKQYSDPLPVFTVTFTGFVLGETPAALGGTLTFATSATALSGVGTYSVAVSGLISPNYDIAWVAGTLTVTAEDARVTYNGSRLVAASGLTENSATLVLSTTVADISASADAAGDSTAGDIRTATVTFVNRATGATLCSAPIVLLSASDHRVGTSTCIATADVATLTSITVGTTVGGNYLRNDASDDVTVTILAATADFLTGAGWIRVIDSRGSLPADAGSKLQVHADAKHKEKSGLTVGVTVDSQTASRKIRISTVSPHNAAVKTAAGGGSAEILATVKVEDVTDAAKRIDGAATLLLSITDNGAPGRNDTITLTVWSSDGTLLLSSRWDGRRTLAQALDGGNLEVH